jgi:hypothetical protein
MRIRGILAAAATVAAGIAMTPAPAHADLFSCTVYYSGTNTTQNCTYVGFPSPNGQLHMEVQGYAWVEVRCNGVKLVGTGVMSSGTYDWYYFQAGGYCEMKTGVNGTLYARST